MLFIYLLAQIIETIHVQIGMWMGGNGSCFSEINGNVIKVA